MAAGVLFSLLSPYPNICHAIKSISGTNGKKLCGEQGWVGGGH